MAELVVVSMFGLIVTEQYVSPAIVNSYGAFNELRYLQAFERLLKLSVPTLWGWLVVFYTLFHLLLNITAEFTGFGDREFYLVRFSFCRPKTSPHCRNAVLLSPDVSESTWTFWD